MSAMVLAISSNVASADGRLRCSASSRPSISAERRAQVMGDGIRGALHGPSIRSWIWSSISLIVPLS